jgi:hypothetical protein
MVAAFIADRIKYIGLNNTEISFNVSKSVFKDCVKIGEHVEKIVLGNPGRKPALLPELENELLNFC